jgi:MoxR-like ATPase
VVGSVGFVGRECELSRLMAAVRGEVRLLLVTGDAGVGKTRFVTAGMRRVAADGTEGDLGRIPADAGDTAGATAGGYAG